MIILRSFAFDAGAVTVGAGLKKIGTRPVWFCSLRINTAAFAFFTGLIVGGFTGKEVEAVLFFTAAGGGTGFFLGVQIADVTAGAVAIGAFDGERISRRRSCFFIFFRIYLSAR